MRRSLLGFVSLTCLMSFGTMYKLQWAGDGHNGIDSEGENGQMTLSKKKIQHFAQFSKLIREMPLF